MERVVDTIARLARPFALDALIAIGLTIAGELEVLLGPSGDGSQLASALALPFATLPLALRRRRPLLPLVALAVVLPLQVPLDGFLVAQAVTPLAALVLALYSAGRYIVSASALAGAALAIALLAATRIAFDPAVETPADAVLTVLYAPLPLLVGRWVRGQALLQHELRGKAEQIERERERDARQAAEAERMRIATDLQGAISGSLAAIVAQAREVPGRVAGRDHAAAHALLAGIAVTAREALADVRRVLGILRHSGPRPLGPPQPASGVAVAAAEHDSAPAVAAADRTAARDGTALDGGAPRLDRSPVATALDGGAAGLDGAPVATAPSAAPRRGSPVETTPDSTAARLDGALVAILFVGAEIELALAAHAGERALAALTAVPIVAPLLWRRRWPLAAAVAVLAAVAVQSTLLDREQFPVFDIAALICSAYAVGAHAGRRTALVGLPLLALGSGVHAAVFHPDGVGPAVVGGIAVPWLVGRTLNSRRRLTRELRERTARMEHAREQEALAAATAERARVARELHDAVAHNISVIAIQAAGAEGIAERDPERAVQCAALIEAVGREALTELGRLIGRREAPMPPPAQPTLARVDALAERAREGGLPVELRVEGAPATLPAGVDLAAYRIVQEGLANASKHAGAARTTVVVRYDRHAVEVEVADDGRANDAAQTPRNGDGHGLVGIRERVALYDGTLVVGRRPSGGFRVHARLPIGPSA